MSVTIKKSQLKYKNPDTGDYVGIDAIAEKKSSEMVSDITTIAQTKLNQINTRATEVQASLPKSGEMEDMIADIFSESKAYKTGDYVIQEINNVNKLYRFKVNHAAGAWDSNQVKEVKLTDDTTEIKSALEAQSLLGIEIKSDTAVAPYNDMDTLPANKIFRIDDFSLLAHAPVSSGYGVAYKFSNSIVNPVVAHQFCIVYNTNDLYYRAIFGSAKAWVKVAKISDVEAESILGIEIDTNTNTAPYNDMNTLPFNKIYRIDNFTLVDHPPKNSGSGTAFGFTFNRSNTAICCQFCVVSQTHEFYYRTWYGTPGEWKRLISNGDISLEIIEKVKEFTSILDNYGEEQHFTNSTSSGNASIGGINWVLDCRGMYIDKIVFDNSTYSITANPEWTTGVIDDEDIVMIDTTGWRPGGFTLGTVNVNKQFDKNTLLVFRGKLPYSNNGATNVIEHPLVVEYVDPTTNKLTKVGSGTQHWCVTGYYTEKIDGLNEDVQKSLIFDFPCDFSLFSNFGVIGDSYTCGKAWNNDETALIDDFDQSWGAILGRSSGAESHIFGIIGSTTASWLADTGPRGLQGMLADDPLQLYILCHVINDANASLTIGDIADLEGVDDPTTLPSTFINNQAKILYHCKQHSPNAKIIFMLSDGYLYNNINKSAYDAATIQVANFYGVPYINQHDHPFYASVAYKSLTKGHPRAQGYSVMAKAIRQLIEECMSKTEYLNYFNTSYIVDGN